MGDVIDVTSLHHCFYKITNNALVFEVKTQANVALGLAEHPGPKADVWINLRKFWISIGKEKSAKVYLPHLVNGDEYRSFWVSWDTNIIKLGRYGEPKPIVTLEHKIPLLQYVTFSMPPYEQFLVSWKFHLRPTLPLPLLRNLNKGEPKWISLSDQLPDDAIIGGYENEVLYIIRSKHMGSLSPGKFVPSERLGYIPWGGEAHQKTDLEVLCGIDYAWVKCSDDMIPPGAIIGGYSEVRGEPLYVGRASYQDHLIPGKVHTLYKSCYIPFQTSEVTFGSFEILVCPSKCIPHYKNVYLPSLTETPEHFPAHVPPRNDPLIDPESDNYPFGYDPDEWEIDE